MGYSVQYNPNSVIENINDLVEGNEYYITIPEDMDAGFFKIEGSDLLYSHARNVAKCVYKGIIDTDTWYKACFEPCVGYSCAPTMPIKLYIDRSGRIFDPTNIESHAYLVFKNAGLALGLTMERIEPENGEIEMDNEDKVKNDAHKLVDPLMDSLPDGVLDKLREAADFLEANNLLGNDPFTKAIIENLDENDAKKVQDEEPEWVLHFDDLIGAEKAQDEEVEIENDEDSYWVLRFEFGNEDDDINEVIEYMGISQNDEPVPAPYVNDNDDMINYMGLPRTVKTDTYKVDHVQQFDGDPAGSTVNDHYPKERDVWFINTGRLTQEQVGEIVDNVKADQEFPDGSHYLIDTTNLTDGEIEQRIEELQMELKIRKHERKRKPAAFDLDALLDEPHNDHNQW